MAIKRKPFQGVVNIVQFNWHLYVVAVVIVLLLLLVSRYVPKGIHRWCILVASLATGSLSLSLLVSYYVYDVSPLYSLGWLPSRRPKSILNLNAGFDETSSLIQSKYSDAKLSVCDFYDPKQHTEVSIKRARKKYPPFPNTIKINTDELPFEDESFDVVVAFFSLHEIRDAEERCLLLKELNRILKPNGSVYITEHLRDLNNFLAYNVGYYHFHSLRSWKADFLKASLSIVKTSKCTPFVTTYILEKNGNSL